MTNFNEMAKIAKGKMLLKEYGQKNNSNEPSVIYLEDGDEFQIQLFNPTNKVVGASIDFNGDNHFYPSNYIVLRPGERVWLERYLDSPHKFQFNTYTVSNNKSSKEAIKDNGDLIISFYYEKKQPVYDYSTITWTGNTTGGYPVDRLYFTSCESTPVTGSITSNYCNSACTSDSAFRNLGISSNSTITASAATSASYTSACTASVQPNESRVRKLAKNLSKTIETGRVEEGSHSNQNFKHVYYDFEGWSFYTKKFKLLPLSRKQYGKEDLTKVYCTNCGKKLSPKFKFCPACSTKVNY